MLTDFDDRSEDTGEVRVHAGVGDAKNANAKRFEVKGPLGVALGLRIMHPAVHFDPLSAARRSRRCTLRGGAGA